ncbi:hypothetical protein M758_UG042800 [Ceratodon purpureus]|nr:hypothetical protein M758_UG042800 [Ceratodon purpureus]
MGKTCPPSKISHLSLNAYITRKTETGAEWEAPHVTEKTSSAFGPSPDFWGVENHFQEDAEDSDEIPHRGEGERDVHEAILVAGEDSVPRSTADVVDMVPIFEIPGLIRACAPNHVKPKGAHTSAVIFVGLK